MAIGKSKQHAFTVIRKRKLHKPHDLAGRGKVVRQYAEARKMSRDLLQQLIDGASTLKSNDTGICLSPLKKADTVLIIYPSIPDEKLKSTCKNVEAYVEMQRCQEDITRMAVDELAREQLKGRQAVMMPLTYPRVTDTEVSDWLDDFGLEMADIKDIHIVGHCNAESTVFGTDEPLIALSPDVMIAWLGVAGLIGNGKRLIFSACHTASPRTGYQGEAYIDSIRAKLPKGSRDRVFGYHGSIDLRPSGQFLRMFDIDTRKQVHKQEAKEPSVPTFT
ncbi:MAG: hypothetical protein P1U63_00755 [Coxiellaceae bacterium]|nr:hypothetical protein [Coxiellaceae bacterium]